MTQPALFISYRRRQNGTTTEPGVDVGGHAKLLYHALTYWFDPAVMFYDLGSLQAGTDFPEELRSSLQTAKLQLVVIGPEWEAEIIRRVATGQVDWLRDELEQGLARPRSELALLPVWLGRNQPPDWSQLPASLQPLANIEDFRFGEREADWQTQFLRLRDRITKLTGIEYRFRWPKGAEQPYHVLPHTLSRHFQDPNHYLGQLHQHLHTSGQVAVVARAALYGMGGLGKTQLALKYSADYRADYAGIWWFRAETTSALQEDAQRCCEKLGVPIAQGATPTQALCHWLERQPDRWLLVYDNVEQPSDPPDLPQHGSHHLLFTSRNPNWKGYAQPLKLVPWTDEQGAAFLQQRLGGEASELAALSHDLGGLPLALEQAAGYLETTQCTVAEYRAMLAGVNTEGLILERDKDQPPLPTKYERSVAATLTLAYAKLSPAAQQLLCLCAFAAPDPIPELWFRETADALPTELQAAANSLLTWNKVVAQLRAYGLVERGNITDLDTPAGKTTTKPEHTLQLHRLTQQVTRAQWADNTPALAGPEHAQAWLAVLVQVCPKEANLPQHWPTYARLVPHSETLQRFWQAQGLDVAAVGRLLDRVARYLLYGPALYLQAVALHQQVLTLRRRLLGEEHPSTLSSMNNLASTLSAQGDLLGSRALLEKTLAICRRVLGEEHPDTLTSMNNLATTRWNQGDLPGARALHEQELAICRRVLGEEHPDTLISMSNLATTLRAQDDLPGARTLQEQVLAIRRRALGEEHPATLTSMNNLAGTLRAQGDLPGARAMHEQVLAICRRVLGEEHPATLTSMGNLAGTLRAQGDLPGARALQEQVLAIHRRVLGEEHPDTLTSMNNLAETLRAHGDLPGARVLHEQVMAICRRVLGEEHPNTLTSMNNLAYTLWQMGEHAAAVNHMRAAAEGNLRKLGAVHANTVDAQQALQQMTDALKAQP